MTHEFIEHFTSGGIFYDIFLILLGMVIQSCITMVQEKGRKKRAETRFRKWKEDKTSEIIPLQYSPCYFDPSKDITIRNSGHRFIVEYPESANLQKILDKDPHFMNNKSSDFPDGGLKHYFEDIDKESNRQAVPNWRNLLDESKNEVAAMFEQSIVEDGKTLFNGTLFGIRSLQSSRIEITERPTLNFELYETDYYTHRVMHQMVEKIRAEYPNYLKPFLHSRPTNQLKTLYSCGNSCRYLRIPHF